MISFFVQRVSTLLFGVAVLLTGHGLQLALVPLRAESMGWSSLAVGMLGSVYFCGFLAGCFLIPKMVGRVGHIRTFARADCSDDFHCFIASVIR